MHMAIPRATVVTSESDETAQANIAAVSLPPSARGAALTRIYADNEPACPSNTFDIAVALNEFHMAFSLPIRETPGIGIDEDLAKLRVALLEEEVTEFVTASADRDLIGIADALADIVYVAYGTALTYGIDLNQVLHEVHRSNMSKLGRDGKPILRSDGKVIKSEQYFRPDITSILQQQDEEQK